MFNAIETQSNKQHAAFSRILKTFNAYHDFINNDGNSDTENDNTANSYNSKNDTYLADIGIERRSDGFGSAWECESQINWKDLGSLHYPRFAKEVMCVGNSCMHGYYRCAAQNYTIRVLSTRHDDDDLEMALPGSLRENWKLVDVQISVGCVCRS
jgi:hypothetical protein